MSMKTVSTELFGEIREVSSLSEYVKRLKSIYYDSAAPRGWRGQSLVSWPLHPTAVRRIKKNGGSKHPFQNGLEQQVRKYEKELITRARNQGHGTNQTGSRKTDLELLATLQHFGAATRLFDFTRNAMTALWFACKNEEYHDRHGLVVGLQRATSSEKIDFGSGIYDALDSLRGRLYCVYEPTEKYDRMTAQQGILVFSRLVDREYGSVDFPPKDDVDPPPYEPLEGVTLTAIAPGLKDQLCQSGVEKPCRRRQLRKRCIQHL
ncbi:hypothetical protein GGP62_003375 [Salinibacter ruber]|jgi:hypothetical protein|uniref:FRG domain-containing protein n=2 Tax=Salinibacter ruber TaxID=146919 RepID=UPI0016212ABD|nr:FRG domain-containing protein [Salinibacter ruber]